MSESKQVKFDELYMAIFDLDSTARTKREYSEKDKCYVVQKADIEKAFQKLKKSLKTNRRKAYLCGRAVIA